ncbi:diacylglycerol/lipid kinase family protein [Sporosalibacterium faouarense]|uniref:diacylglycerol/lipid kinase family protein n=1 Tax=Sporosalibacterium faouarense TaxID=516123 RepID=UPI00141D21FF|nr:YegS/Rv2252/BmrU family lipid kinase [Sporosalibacterium faouarense]MTI48595.1 YegS/Rv2252/BmrU family lipid kinase [Bacillota bacterium]
MKKIRVIYNPSSGTQTIQRRLDLICKILLDNGYILGKFATEKKYDAMNETIRTCKEDWDIIVACGGDGTINEVASGIAKSERKIPVAILAAGTVNDFANSLGLPKDAKEFCNMIMNGKTLDADLGKINDSYFVNVAAGGLLTNIAHQVPSEVKTVLGRMAYYMEGLKEIPRQMFNAFKVNIESEEYSIMGEEIALFLISNSSYIGGFKKLAPKADIMDGKLDTIIIRKSEIQDIITILIDLIKGEHINHPKVKYFRTEKITIDCDNPIDVDIDGEYGGELPATFKVVPGCFKIFIK